ncbi:RHS repeat-associated core domain-containing protein [Methylococcaceae bacterium WWC4]|nr:RHS repeat-associated core domain-containing protein [Methylococcaceae bacterium WWC4]
MVCLRLRFANRSKLGNIHLAVIDQRPDSSLVNLAYIETDFTNTPRFLRRPAGDLTQPISAWPIAPYGDTPALEDPDGDGAKTTFNLRYPGQYYDAFSGLHYNHTRYFSPHVGRYLQPDLIGLEGGTNVYTYANGNPVSYTDPTGTESESCGCFSIFNLFNFSSWAIQTVITEISESSQADNNQESAGNGAISNINIDDKIRD